MKHWLSTLQASSEAQRAKHQAQRDEKARAVNGHRRGTPGLH